MRVCARLCVCARACRRRSRGLDLQEEDHISPQVILTSSSWLSLAPLGSGPLGSARLGSERLHLDQVRDGSARALRAPVMLSAVKMEGHEAPDWSGFYSEEVGEPQQRTRPEPEPQKFVATKFLRKFSIENLKVIYKKPNQPNKKD